VTSTAVVSHTLDSKNNSEPSETCYCQHAMLVKTAGIKHLIVLVNNMDHSTVLWDLAR
jgi:translation elongation factor EF-1alpha